MSKIYVYRPTTAYVDCAGVAFAEDGDEIAVHISSSHSWFRSDMGLSGEAGIGRGKHQKYREKYPDGYELVEVIGREALQAHIDAGDIKGLSFVETETRE